MSNLQKTQNAISDDLHTLGKAMRDATAELVKINEDHNAAIEKIIGKPPGWNDSYLDAAREAIAAFGKALAETPAAPPAPAVVRRYNKETGLFEYVEEDAAPPAPADVAGLVERLDEIERAHKVAEHQPNLLVACLAAFPAIRAALTAQAARVAELEWALRCSREYIVDTNGAADLPIVEAIDAALAASEKPASGEGDA